MQKTAVLVLILHFGLLIYSQENLIVDSSFEKFDTCGVVFFPFDDLSFWFNPTNATPDPLTPCNLNGGGALSTPTNYMGFQVPKSDSSYAGVGLQDYFGSYYREYIATKLSHVLAVGKSYKVTFYTSLANRSCYSIDNIGVLFSPDSNFTTGPDWNILAAPQLETAEGYFITDTLNWTKVSFTYQADGTEKYMTIGNFKDGANTDTMAVVPNPNSFTAYYYIDDVSLYEVNDTVIPPKDCNLTCNNLLQAGNDKLEFQYLTGNTSIKIYNSIGQKVFESNNYQNNWQPEMTGLYIYEVTCASGTKQRGKIVAQ